jgi:hypothetical protein
MAIFSLEMMKTKKNNKTIACITACVALVLVSFVVGMVLTRPITSEQCEQIRPGAVESDVLAILGSPNEVKCREYDFNCQPHKFAKVSTMYTYYGRQGDSSRARYGNCPTK